MTSMKLHKRLFVTALISALVLICYVAASDGAEKTNTTKCKIKFNVQGWSAFYETASGTGTIRCNNGQSAQVRIRVKGGGLTAGKNKLSGHGTFSEVADIRELFGAYADAGVHAGVIKSADAKVLTKGSVSLALAAKGRGFDLGIAFGKFTIRPMGKTGTKR